MSAFGLDVGTATMKAVLLQESNGAICFKSSIIAKTPQKGILSDASLDQEEIASTIHRMVIDAKISSHDAHVALSDNHVFSKVIEMPLLTDKELSSAIFWEAEQHIPMPLPSINLDWKVLRRDLETSRGKIMQVLLVGAPVSILSKYQKVFELAGINIVSMETETMAVIRSTVTGVDFPNSLIVNIGSLGTSLAIVQKGVLVFLYSIPLGGIAMNRSIATEFGFSAKQAEEYKKAYGLNEINFGGKIKIAIEPILSTMITEIKKALSFYIDKYEEEHPIKQIILTGGTARLPGIIPIFVEMTGIETVIANPWKALAIRNVPNDLQDRGSEYSIAVGLAAK
jgi:type IV pilus assembly protein PilM